MEELYQNAETGCCPRFNPQPWKKTEVTFKDKLFVKDHVISFLHIPLNFKAVMMRNMKRIAAAGALAPQPMVLSDEKSLWGADVYIAVAKNVPAAEMVTISGTFLSMAFEGPYKNIPRWITQMMDYIHQRRKELKKLYFFYTTCPKCAKFYGKNYVVLLAQI